MACHAEPEQILELIRKEVPKYDWVLASDKGPVISVTVIAPLGFAGLYLEVDWSFYDGTHVRITGPDLPDRGWRQDMYLTLPEGKQVDVRIRSEASTNLAETCEVLENIAQFIASRYEVKVD